MKDATTNDDLAKAIQFYAMRWLLDIFPCTPRGKEPMLRGWQRGSVLNPKVIAARWLNRPTANIGLLTGERNGFFVLDVDGPKGQASLEKLLAANGPLPKGPIQQTGDGRHHFFAWPVGRTINNSTSRVAPGIDIRGKNGYVIVPPSVHPSGERYRWLPGAAWGEVKLPAAPDWLLDLVAPRPAPGGFTAAKTSDQWTEMVGETIQEGRRNATIASVTGHLLARNVNSALVAELMLALNAWRCEPPLDTTEVNGIVASIDKRERQRREWAT